MGRETYQDLKRSLNKHGQQYPIHKCKFGIIDGYKRFESLVGTEPSPKDRGPRFTEHPEIETLEQYVELLKATQPVIMTAEERRNYIRGRGRELRNLGISAEEVVGILRRLTGASSRTIYRHLPDDVKLEYKRLPIDKLGKKEDISEDASNILLPPEEFSYMDKRLWANFSRKIGAEPLLKLLQDTRDHFLSLKQREVKSKALQSSIPELLEVTYAELEKAGFPKLDDTTMRFWKFLSEEYDKRYGNGASLEEE